MPLKQRAKLILKRHFVVVIFLVFNVPDNVLRIRLANGKSCVSALPIKFGIAGAVIRLHPFRTPLLNFFNQDLQSVIFRKEEHCVDMIFVSSDGDRGTFPLLEYSGLVRPEFVLHFA